ncbi:DUF4158 domain-containing protein [Streptosporangium sp. G11]|uniref:DUF4158 domain-containing protein n=1 Tax=Streptosporangium sp. G11 TaxID=3436926 RepID=UPI003EB9F267
MTSVERTAYPEFGRLVFARELYTFFSPSEEEMEWVRAKTDTDEHQLALAVALKCFQKLGRFAKKGEAPAVVVEHVRQCLFREDADESLEPVYASARTEQSHRVLVRLREGVKYAPGKARKLAEREMTKAAWVKNYPPDLINVALERLTQAGLELPAFSTLDSMESTIRGQVNGQIFRTIWVRLRRDARARLESLVVVVGPGGKSDLERVKKAARRATWSKFKDQAAHLAWLDGLADTDDALDGIAASKIADFAGEAEAADVDVFSRYAPDGIRRMAVLTCLVHASRGRARDDLAQMLCKRMAVNNKKAKAQLELFHQRQRAVTEQLIVVYRNVLQGLAPGGPVGVAEVAATQMVLMAVAALTQEQDGAGDDQATADPGGTDSDTDQAEAEADPGGAGGDPGAVIRALLKAVRVQAAGVGSVLAVVEDAGGFDSQLADIEEVTAYRGDNHELLVQQFFKADRATMLALAGALRFEATSSRLSRSS